VTADQVEGELLFAISLTMGTDEANSNCVMCSCVVAGSGGTALLFMDFGRAIGAHTLVDC
jgi:hypothetical protein